MDVCRLVARQAAALVAGGLCAGGMLAAALNPILGSMLIGARGIDLVSISATAAFIGMVAVLAAGLPAWSAARVQPATALRGE